MGKLLSIIIGAAVAIVGVILIMAWWQDLLLVLRGTVPAFLVFGGVIALIAGLSELKDSLKAKENK
jgi:TRAP-type uncharacterized transport system fused permease subunit